jgi:hypothetical protein
MFWGFGELCPSFELWHIELALQCPGLQIKCAPHSTVQTCAIEAFNPEHVTVGDDDRIRSIGDHGSVLLPPEKFLGVSSVLERICAYVFIYSEVPLAILVLRFFRNTQSCKLNTSEDLFIRKHSDMPSYELLRKTSFAVLVK